jgi:cell division protein FtsB
MPVGNIAVSVEYRTSFETKSRQRSATKVQAVETLGSLIDKLTIANVRLWHLEETKHDTSADDAQVAAAARKIGVVNKQRNALIDEIDAFLDEARRDPSRPVTCPKVKLY